MKFDLVDGDSDVLSTTAFGEYSRNTIRRTRDRLSRLSKRVTGRAASALNRVKSRIDGALDEEVNRLARRVRKSFNSRYIDDIYQFLDTQEKLAGAPPKMVTAMLASPIIRKRVREQRMDAWKIKATDARLLDDSIERVIYNGVSKKITHNEKEVWVSEYEYGANEIENETLFIEDQLDAIATINVAESLIEDGIDPSSPLGEKMVG